MAKKNVHVVPNDGQWGVKIEGNEKMSRNFETQKEASVYGKQRAIENSGELLIHAKNGQIREKNSFGNDPKNVKG
jgi:hypothetical protein